MAKTLTQDQKDIALMRKAKREGRLQEGTANLTGRRKKTKTPKVTKLPTAVAKNGDSKQRDKGKTKGSKQTFAAHKGDFENNQKITVVGEIPNGRAKCFKSGMTVQECLDAQKKAGFRGRRAAIRRAQSSGAIKIK